MSLKQHFLIIIELQEPDDSKMILLDNELIEIFGDFLNLLQLLNGLNLGVDLIVVLLDID